MRDQTEYPFSWPPKRSLDIWSAIVECKPQSMGEQTKILKGNKC